MKTSPPVKPMATTTSLVQNGQSSFPSRISCAVRSIKTQRDQTTHVIAITWKETEHKIFLLSLWVIFKDCHCLVSKYKHNFKQYSLFYINSSHRHSSLVWSSGVASSIVGMGRGQYLYIQVFEINSLQGLWKQIYEYCPTSPQLSSLAMLVLDASSWA